jgi:hypothetical protein
MVECMLNLFVETHSKKEKKIRIMNYLLLFFQYLNYFSWSHGPLYTLQYCVYNWWPKVHRNRPRNFQLPYVAISLSKDNQYLTLLLQPRVLVFSSIFFSIYYPLIRTSLCLLLSFFVFVTSSSSISSSKLYHSGQRGDTSC